MPKSLPSVKSKRPKSGKGGDYIELPGLSDLKWEPPPDGLSKLGDPDESSPWYAPDLSDVKMSDYSLTRTPIGLGIEKVSASGCSICVDFNYTVGFIQTPTATVCYLAPSCRPPRPVRPEFWQPGGIPERPPLEVFEQQGNIAIVTYYPARRRQYYSSCNYENAVSSTDLQSPYSNTFYKTDNELWAAKTIRRSGENAQGVFFEPADSQTASYSSLVSFDPMYPDNVRVHTAIGTHIVELDWATFPECGNVRYLQTGALIKNNTVSINGSSVWPPVEPEIEEPESPPTPRVPNMDCCADVRRLEAMVRRLVAAVGTPTNVTVPIRDKTKNVTVRSLSEAVKTWSEHQSKDASEIYKVVEPRAFENASYPMHLTHPGASGQKPVRNYMQAWEVLFRQIDKANGAWPITVQVKDINPAQEGDQSVKLQIWSIADGIKQLMEYALDMEGDGDVSNNLLVRMAAMLIQQHQVLEQVRATTTNTETYLDYKVKQKVNEIPSTLNPLLPTSGRGFGQAARVDENTEESTEKLMPHLLKNTYLKVKVTDIEEKRLLGERLVSIERHAASAAAGNTMHYKGEETLKKLLDAALAEKEMDDYIMRQNVKKALGKDVDLKDFVKDAEKGYPSVEGKIEENASRPYGRKPENAPKIRKTRKVKR